MATWTALRGVGRAVALLLLVSILAGCAASTPRSAADVADVGAGPGWCASLIAHPASGSPAPGALDLSLQTCADVDDWLRAVREPPRPARRARAARGAG